MHLSTFYNIWIASTIFLTQIVFNTLLCSLLQQKMAPMTIPEVEILHGML